MGVAPLPAGLLWAIFRNPVLVAAVLIGIALIVAIGALA